jgi:hypothetical protein
MLWAGPSDTILFNVRLVFAQYLGASHQLRPSGRRSLPRLTGGGVPYRRFSQTWGWDPDSTIFSGAGPVCAEYAGPHRRRVSILEYYNAETGN